MDGGYITITAWIKPYDTGTDYPRIVDRDYDDQFAFYVTTIGAANHLGFAVDVDSDEDNTLKNKYLQDDKVDELARIFQRQPSAIRSRLRKLGLVGES